ncbi:MAG: dihydroorotate dehydrogenase [Saccharofermentanales bacterium]
MGLDSIDLSVKTGDIVFKNPVIPASGTFGFGREIEQYYDLSVLGGIASKGITRFPRKGNPPPRIAETPSGMLNSVGLQNPGILKFIDNELEHFTSLDCISIINIAGNSVDEYVEMSEMLQNTDCDIIELNLSCPNVKEGCMAFGNNTKGIESVMKAVRKVTAKPLWVKLTPNTTSITENAKAAESSGADAISLVNTFLGLAIDLKTRRPVLKNNYGGLSGPAIKPIALRMVNEVYLSVSIPVIGLGGIMNATDVLEFMMAGATAVQIGTANLVNPYICKDIIKDLEILLENLNVKKISSLIGSLQLW